MPPKRKLQVVDDMGVCPMDIDEPYQPLKRTRKATIPKALKAVVWQNTFGDNGIAECIVCNKQKITPFNFECGHIIAEANGGKIIQENLRPICALCNRSMGKKDMRDFALTFFQRHIHL